MIRVRAAGSSRRRRPRRDRDRRRSSRGRACPECGAGKPAPPSEHYRLGQNPIPEVWRKAPLSNHIDLDAKLLFKLISKSHEIEKAPPLDMSTSRSRSLELFASPHRTDPNTRTFRAP